MLYVHSDNMNTKIAKNYNNKGNEIQLFYNNKYLPVRNSLSALDYQSGRDSVFEEAAEIITDYYAEIENFSNINRITSQSKFTSTFLEEISSYLFAKVPEIENGTYGIYNKKVFAGLKLGANGNLSAITKDVDFCIGKEFNIVVQENGSHLKLIMPIVAVEVKTYLDATMFGEIKSSSKTIRSASPYSSAYVLIGYTDLADEHIIAARQDSTLTEMFALRRNSNSPFDASALHAYWEEITTALVTNTSGGMVPEVGRLLQYYRNLVNP